MSQALAAKHDAPHETAGLLSIIEKFATDPSIDPLKLEKMLDMQERIFNKNAELAFNSAMTDVQAALKPVFRNKHNDQTRSNFADFEQVWNAMNPVVTGHGFALSFGTDNSPLGGFIRIVCDCSHVQGHSRRYFVDLPIDNMGLKGNANKTALHGVGSTMSYGRRYLAMLIFNVALTNEDNDGNGDALEPDITDWLTAINDCTTMEELQAAFKEAYAENRPHKNNIRVLTQAKDAKKKELSND